MRSTKQKHEIEEDAIIQRGTSEGLDPANCFFVRTSFIHDSRFSPEARALWMRFGPCDEWQAVSVEDMVERWGQKTNCIRKCIKQLLEHGYVEEVGSNPTTYLFVDPERRNPANEAGSVD